MSHGVEYLDRESRETPGGVQVRVGIRVGAGSDCDRLAEGERSHCGVRII
jgi:hypothetical protein